MSDLAKRIYDTAHITGDFLLRSGKSMAMSRQVITLGFREPPLRMFRVPGRDARVPVR